jgi:predicted phosphodiesterase
MIIASAHCSYRSSIVKIAHLTDLHITTLPPHPSAFFDRRVSGALNLTVLGRGEKYRSAGERGAAAVAEIVAERPDAVVFGGDASSLAETEELAGAAQVLRPLLELGVPCVALAGNHDRYTRRSQRERRFERAFADWQLIDGDWQTIEMGGQAVTLVDTARANWGIWDSRGLAVPLLQEPPEFVFSHYALLGPDGGPDRELHALRNHIEVIEWLAAGPGTTWCCGHLHHSFTARRGALTQFCAGSVGGPLRSWQMIDTSDDRIDRTVYELVRKK